MDSLVPRSDPALAMLLEREKILAHRLQTLEASYSGLRDLDLWLELIAVRLRISTAILERLHDGDLPAFPGRGPTDREPSDGTADAVGTASAAAAAARERALAAAASLEELRLLEVSEDQKQLLNGSGALEEVRTLLESFVTMGGGALLEEEAQSVRNTRLVAQAVVEAVRKFVAPEDEYRQAFKAESLPPLLRRVVLLFWPILARERQKDPPYGIAEGQEVLLSSQRMKMPLSQAVYYLEHELLPHLESEVERDPGNPLLERRLKLARDRLREYRNIRTIPRATPLNLEHGFYTDWLSHYTADGELLVTVDLPVQMRSGTNLDRLREYIQDEVVRRLVGRGVSETLDADYRYRKSLDSGRRGSSRVPSRKVDVRRGFIVLKEAFPLLQRLEDRTELLRLIELVRSAGARKAAKLLADHNRRGPVTGLLDRLPGREPG